MKSAVNNLFSRFYSLRNLRLNRIMQKPEKVQAQLFERLIYAARNTEWGHIYDFKNIRSPKDFQTKVPLQEYETLYPYIKRMMHGEANVLWPGKISFYSKSSGTTNDKSKFLSLIHISEPTRPY